MHIHNYNKCITITDIQNFMHSYHGLIQVLKLITDLCLFGTPVGVTELILIQNLCLFRTPIGVTELRLMLQSLNLFEGTRRYHRDYGTYTGFAELNLIREYP